MPQLIDVPGHGVVEFPDGMSEGDITKAIQANMVKPEPSMLDQAKQEAGNAVGGLVRGAGSIGATLLWPIDKATDLIKGDRKPGLNSLVTGKAPLSRNEERRMAMDEGLRSLGVDTDSTAFKVGKFGGELAGTAGVGGVLAKGAQAVGASAPVVQALATSGMRAGGLTGAKALGVRSGAGALVGGTSAGMVDPTSVADGALVGGALPPALMGAGKVGNAIRSVWRGPEVPEATRVAVEAAHNAGYVLPPSQAKPTLVNRAIEGLAGKISVAQNASVRNQEVTNALAKRALGLADDAPLNLETLDTLRKQAGTAYADIAGLGQLDVGAGKLPASVNVQRGKDALMQPYAKVDAADLVEAWKQANHDATAYRRAYGRDANPETLAKSKALAADANAISDFLEKRLNSLGLSDMVKNLKDARVKIAKTYTVEKALNDASGNVSGKALAKELDKGKPLTSELRQAASFAQAFPKAAQTPEAMGSLPQVSPLDWIAATGLSSALSSPAAMASVLARPAARAAALAPIVQNGLPRAQKQLVSPDPGALQLLFARSSPLALTDR